MKTRLIYTATGPLFRRNGASHSHLINLFEWADGLSKVLKIKILWSKVFEKLVKTEHVEMMNGKRYVKWKEFLGEYTVKLRGGCKEWQDHVVSRITSAVLQSGNDLLTAFDEMDADKNGVISQNEFNTALRREHTVARDSLGRATRRGMERV